MFKVWRKDRDGRSKQPARARGFLVRLATNRKGNVLAIVGAALIPLLAMIGTGVDLSRAYMAKARLQAACDAGALAGRRVMTEDVMNTQVRNEAIRYFNFNFPQAYDSSVGRVLGPYQTAAVTPTVTRPENGTVRMVASTTIPTTIMRMFGFSTLPLNVNCDAALNFVNTEIVLVLDVTGSMASNLNGVPKIQGLRDAVMALYDELLPTQQQLEANGLRLRYGIVPYSSTVNVGSLISLQNPEFLTARTTYNTRVANYNAERWAWTDTVLTLPEPGLLVAPGTQRLKQTSASSVDGVVNTTNCGRFGSNTNFTQGSTVFNATGGINGDADIYVREGSSTAEASAPSTPGINYVRYQFARQTAAWSSNPADRVCDRTVTVTRRTYERRWAFSNWVYQAAEYDTSAFRLFTAQTPPAAPIATPVTVASNTGGTVPDLPYAQRQLTVQQIPTVASNVTVTGGSVSNLTTTTMSWNGCIEERQTNNTINTNADLTIPDNAFDLNVNLVPDARVETQWRPMWPQIAYSRANGTAPQTSAVNSYGSGTCPAPARRLAVFDRQGMLDYVNSLQPTGSTYHDIGMIWGARLISPGGLFSDACEVFNGMTCSRHIIFMTDGQMDTDNDIYQAYGIERNDGRVSGQYSAGETERNDRHLQRFRMICNAARGLNTAVWVIAFGTSLSNDMRNCASNANQASTSGNRDQLIARFRQIGNQIGALRLTQ